MELSRLSRGTRVDLHMILRKFIATKSVRFREFSTILMDMSFNELNAGIQTGRQQYQFTEECYLIVIDMFNAPFGLQTRIGCLYLLYALYNIQPLEVKAKIRVTSKFYMQLEQFNVEMLELGHLEPMYVLHKLDECLAFHYVANRIKLYPHRIRDYRNAMKRCKSKRSVYTIRRQMYPPEELYDHMSNYGDLMSKPSMKDLEKACNEYDRSLCKIGVKKTKLNIHEHLKREVNGLLNLQKNNRLKEQDREEYILKENKEMEEKERVYEEIRRNAIIEKKEQAKITRKENPKIVRMKAIP